MCLKTYQKRMYKATRDIVVYKLVVEDRTGDIYTPCTLTNITQEQIIGKVPFEAYGKINKFKGYAAGVGILDGMIHTYGLASDAKDAMTILSVRRVEKTAVYECIIPKGTQYYKGYVATFTYPLRIIIGYASKQIRFVKKMDF